MPAIELLTTEGCHLCDRAREMLARAAPEIPVRAVDIAEDDELIEQWGERIPVLRYRGYTLAWPFSLLDIREFVGRGE